jgi:hypothetical protein
MFKDGSDTAFTLRSDEYVEYHQVDLVTAPGGDCIVFSDSDDDNSADTGEVILRGTFAANGGMVKELCPPYVGLPGAKPHVTAPAGVVDVSFKGTLRRQAGIDPRPAWREPEQA